MVPGLRDGKAEPGFVRVPVTLTVILRVARARPGRRDGHARIHNGPLILVRRIGGIPI